MLKKGAKRGSKTTNYQSAGALNKQFATGNDVDWYLAMHALFYANMFGHFQRYQHVILF